MHEDQPDQGKPPAPQQGKELIGADPFAGGGDLVRALARRLRRPAGETLTEEQTALSLSIARDLCLRVVAALGRRGAVISAPSPSAVWDLLWDAGLDSASLIAGPVLARVEEHRWRRSSASGYGRAQLRPTGAAADPGLFDSPADDDDNDIDQAYLALRIADGARRDGGQGPLMPLAELPTAARAALVDDVVAALIALSPPESDHHALFAAADQLRGDLDDPVGIDAASRGYAHALASADLLEDALALAIDRRDWCAVIALFSVRVNMNFAHVAAVLVLGPQSAVAALCRQTQLDDDVAAKLIAGLPARATADDGSQRLAQLHRRAAVLRARHVDGAA